MPHAVVLVRNASSSITDDQLKAAMPAFQIQVSRDFAPAWGVDATLLWDADVPATDPRRVGAYLIVALENADQAGALGYHDLQKNGQPIGKVFVGTTIQYGGQWTVTFSHELLEMLGDAWINEMALDAAGRYAYCKEAGDAVEDDTLGYDINGTLVTDFVLLSWFDPMVQPGVKLAFKTPLTHPFSLAHGGYIGVLDTHTGRWSQHTMAVDGEDGFAAARRAHHAIARPGSRRERRQRGHASWQRSTID